MLIGILPLGYFLFMSLNQTKESRRETLDSHLMQEEELEASPDWWESRRGKFNWYMIFAGVFAFLLYTFFLPYFFVSMPNFELRSNFFTFALPIMTYLVYIGVANVFYNLGPLVESLRNPKKPQRFRRNWFFALCSLFSLLPQLFVLSIFF